MRRPYLTAPGKFEIRTVARPVPGAGQVLVRNVVNALCGSEFPAYRGLGTVQPLHLRIAEYPVELAGHESAGIVEAVGPRIRGLRIGECVTGNVWEGYAEFCVAKPSNLVRFDPALPFRHAAMSTVVAETFYAAQLILRRRGTGPALVIGLGAGGLLIVQHLKRAGCKQILALDRREDRAALARRFGAEATTEATDIPTESCTLVVEASGTIGGTNLAFYAAAPEAVVGMFGRPLEAQKTMLEEIFHRRLSVLSLRSPRNVYEPRRRRQALEMIRSGRVEIDPLLGDDYPLDRIADAFAAASSFEAAPRIFIEHLARTIHERA